VYVCLTISLLCILSFFFFNETSTTKIYTLSLHDALPISPAGGRLHPLALETRREDIPSWEYHSGSVDAPQRLQGSLTRCGASTRSEEHTSELQSRGHLVCRLLLEKKKRDQSET